MGLFWPALLGLGTLVAAGVMLSDGGGGSTAPGSYNGAGATLGNIIDNVGEKTGTLQSGEPTDDVTPTFTGTGTPGNTVIIKDGDNPIGQATVDKDGKWEFTPVTPLPEGLHQIIVIEKDPQGHESPPSKVFELSIDLSAPDQPVISDVLDNVGMIQGSIAHEGMTDDATPTLSGGGQTPGDIVIIKDNGSAIDQVIVDKDGKWTFTPNLPLNDGKHEFTLIAKDPVGNASEESDPLYCDRRHHEA